MSQEYKGFTIPADADTADGPRAFIEFVDSLLEAMDLLVPPGVIAMHGSATTPPGWATCQGQVVATTGTYARLFAAIGYTFGGGGASFWLPNLQGRVPVGLGDGWTQGLQFGASNTGPIAIPLPQHSHGGQTGNDTVWHKHNINRLEPLGSGPLNQTVPPGSNWGFNNTISGDPTDYHHHFISNDGTPGANITIDLRQKGLGLNFIIKF